MIKAHIVDGYIHQIAFLVKESKVCSAEIEKVIDISSDEAKNIVGHWQTMIVCNNRLKANLVELQKTWVYYGKD